MTSIRYNHRSSPQNQNPQPERVQRIPASLFNSAHCAPSAGPDHVQVRVKLSTSNHEDGPRPRRIVLLLGNFAFFLSGGAALIYEISWARQIGLLFGHTLPAAAVVLCSYFAGMAIGCVVGGRAGRRTSPLLGYAVAEFVAASWACVIPLLLRLVESPANAALLDSPSVGVQTVLRFGFCFLLLMPAAIALGATLPFMAEFVSSANPQTLQPSGMQRVSVAYALNTAGALCGVTGTTFYLLPNLGVVASSYAGAGISATCGLIACSLALAVRPGCAAFHGAATAQAPRLHEEQPFGACADSLPPMPRSEGSRIWLAAAALSGFGTMSLEVLYIRLFSLVFHNSTYTFGAVIAVFIAALAIGAAIAATLQKTRHIRRLAGRIACLGALATMLSLVVFVQATELDYFSYGNSFIGYMGAVFLLVGTVVGPPIVCLGTLLPFAWRADTRAENPRGIVGRLTAANAVCSAFGAWATSFVILPQFGLWQAFTLLAALYLAVSLVLLWREGQRSWMAGGAILFAAIAFFTLTRPLDALDSPGHERLVRRWYSAYGVVDVVQSRDTGSFKVRQNLHYRFGQTKSAVREFRQAHLPLLLHDRPQDVFVMGLGTGMTAGGTIPHAEVRSVTIAELIPEAVDAARLLSPYNNRVVDHPKVNVRIDDGRHALLSSARRFDVVISDLFVPWESETGYLYTVEHYRVARARLKPGGLFCQWIPVYQLGEREFELIADSFAAAFPVTTLWAGAFDAEQPTIALLGTDAPLEIDGVRLTARLADLEARSGLHDDYLPTPQMLHALYLGDWPQHRSHPLNTDEHPRVEFSTPISQRDRRLLHGTAFHRYFNEKLTQLPNAHVNLHYPDGQVSETVAERRAWRRFLLFGE